ncbi:acetyl-CoA carboxylase biotin carboxyl carrier protein subunit, partial [Pseudomonadota bacterium]
TGSYMVQYMGSEVSITIRSPETSEFEKFMPKVEKNLKPTKLKAPITGKIVKFKVKEGDELEPGKDILLIEAMKMENMLRAENKAKVKKIHFKDGDLVGVGETIIEFE